MGKNAGRAASKTPYAYIITITIYMSVVNKSKYMKDDAMK